MPRPWASGAVHCRWVQWQESFPYPHASIHPAQLGTWPHAEVLCNLAIGSYCIFSKLVTFISSGYVFIQFHCFWPIWGLHRLERVADPMLPGERQHARCQRLRSRLHQVCEALHEVGWFYEGRTKGPSWPSAGFPIAIYRRQDTETGQIIVEL